MTYKEAWKIVLGAVNSTREVNVKEALFLLAEAAARQDELNELSKMSLDQMME